MSSPHVGDLVFTPKGQGRVERVFYGIITKLLPSRRRFVICTVHLSEPYTVKIAGRDCKVERVEAEVPYQRSRTYEQA